MEVREKAYQVVTDDVDELEQLINRELMTGTCFIAEKYRGRPVYYGRDCGFYFAFLGLCQGDVVAGKTLKQLELNLDNRIFSESLAASDLLEIKL